MEETRDPAGSHYTLISKSASGPSRSRRQSAIWPCICLYVVIIVDIYVCNSSVYTWCNRIYVGDQIIFFKICLSQLFSQYASGVRVVARPSPAHHMPGITGM